NNDASGIITNAFGNEVEIFNTGTITNTYGIYIGDITSGTQTNQAYGLYQVDANARNYFAGNVGIGDSSPLALLTVGTSDAFQVDASGNITSSSLAGIGTRCLQTDAGGVISPAASACGSGSGTITIGTTTITSGTGGRVLYDNAGVVGEMTTT